MSRIFISHSTNNNSEALALRDWLVEQGWDDLFLDLDPERGLKAGERWQAALKKAAERCEMVIFLISPDWASSKWCLAEFLLARNLNKRIFGVIIRPVRLADLPTEMTAEWQLVDLTTGKLDYEATAEDPHTHAVAHVSFAKSGLDRLRIGLMQAGIDARYFAWPPENDPQRAPYRGLQPLEAEDAGIFFGRDGPTVVALDMLRGLRDAAPPRMLVILGASGAGKSSFLRAGLLPRLSRESQHFFTLPVVRPERGVLTCESGLIASLERAANNAGLGQTRAQIRKAIENGALSLASLLDELLKATTSSVSNQGATVSHPPTLVLAIDQAEELFRAEGAEESLHFLDLLRGLVIEDRPALSVIFTIRSDSYELLQTADALRGLRQHTLSLPPMPKGAYAEVIKGPARRLESTQRALKIEERLVDALLADIEEGGAKDALPLLAFTLERLYREHGGDGDLTLEEYEDLGRVKGSIEAAVQRALHAADADSNIPRDSDERIRLLRRGLIPWLAGIDPENGSPRRRIARRSEIPSDSRPLIDLLVEQRLLSTDISESTGEITIEPMHEALLRQWDLLRGWLAEDSIFLGVMEGVRRASRDWLASDKNSSWLSHVGERLRAADRLSNRPDLAASLSGLDADYIAACRNAERRTVSRRRMAQVSASLLGLVILAGLVAWFNQAYLEERWHWVTKARPYREVHIRPHVLTPEAEAALKPRAVFRECTSNCPEMIVVPAGEFLMGAGEGEGSKYERPQRKVSISRPFAVSIYEVTFDDWDACVAYGDCPQVGDSNWGRGRQPVINVTWDHAQIYVKWLSRMTAKTYRLLSEAEWEYAARAGTTTHYHWGNEVDKGKANCKGCGSKWEDNDAEQAAPVGSFAPNAFGLYDMHGNVWEWVEDVWHENYVGAPSDGSAWVQDGDSESRVLRGGGFKDGPDEIRSINHRWDTSDNRGNDGGFRIARTLSSTSDRIAVIPSGR